MQTQILIKLLLIPGILLGLTLHEYAHALTADRLGDKTPRFQGRLTLNPFVHLDPIGFIALLIFGFGWAKPVQTNPSAFKRYYKDDLKVSLAGPIANLVVAFLSGIVMALFVLIAGKINIPQELGFVIYNILYLSLSINCTLFVLNLIPIPGFDGFHILRDLFPKFFYNFAEQVYRYQFLIMIIFIATPIAGILIDKPAGLIEDFILRIVNMI